ncbi:zinc finger protein 62-like [Anoplophora glabripennis]|uniref:zinc finger protein 62-like n=1 Tax=Anoplophora glabripennis TaxID=217634 RepID=UPI00087403A0|nr:zinc finger protein 62-like [Anoplophora glabripennis]
MARKSYLNASKMIKMCRVCFTQSNSIMFDLADDMDLDDAHEIPILVALEKVVSAKILLNEEFPQCICPMCISILKMSYKFVTQFETTQNKLSIQTGIYPIYRPHFSQSQFQEDMNFENEREDDAPVEIIVGEQKFNLKDLFIVEEPEKEQCNFKGFLKNLGQEVSATFADKSNNKMVLQEQNEDAVSIYMSLNENNVLPVRELKIDDDTNTINCIILEENDPVDTEENENMKFIEIETSDKDIESLILKIEDENTEKNKENEETIPKQEIKKATKRKKIIKERLSGGMIIMEPLNMEKQVEQSKIESEDDIFEREIQFPCELCKKIYPTKRSLRAHTKRTHFPKTRQYTCEICGYQNNTRSGYMHHKVKHKGKQFICEICSKTYYTRAVLKVHMATHVNKRQHLCNVCGKGFNYPNALVYHMRLHTGEKKYKCDYCGEKFRMPNALKRHERIHTGERPYKCSFCERAFCSKGEVQCHENIHTGYRPYHCKHCWKGFTKTHNLKLHLLSHEGPHKCDICGKSFIEMAILAMHFKIAHKDLMEREEEEDADEVN